MVSNFIREQSVIQIRQRLELSPCVHAGQPPARGNAALEFVAEERRHDADPIRDVPIEFRQLLCGHP